jgi:hypothetical protein
LQSSANWHLLPVDQVPARRLSANCGVRGAIRNDGFNSLVTSAKREADNAQAFDQRAGQTTPQQGKAGSSQRREASE